MASALAANPGVGSYGTFADRAQNPVARQGAMDANAAYDSATRNGLVTENRTLGVSLYQGGTVGDDQIMTIAPHEVVYVSRGRRGGLNDTRLQVLSSLNGQGAEATARYPNDPEMVRLCVKAGIQPIGQSIAGVSAARGEFERGTAVALAGLNTAPMGNGATGPNTPAGSNRLAPGDLVCWDVPEATARGLQQGGAGSSSARETGVPRGKFLLQARRCDPSSSGSALRKHIVEILRDERNWHGAMGQQRLGTRTMAAAAKGVVDSYLSAIALGVGQLVAQGVLQPTPEYMNRLGDVEGVGAFDALGQGDAALPGKVDNPGLRKAGAETALHVAELLGVIRESGRTGVLSRTEGGSRGIRQLRMAVNNTVFHDVVEGGSVNTAFEFGFEPTANTPLERAPGRYPGGRGLRENGYGQLLDVQMNHVARAVSGFHAAVMEELRFVGGKTTTGASEKGSNKFHYAAGICRP